MNPEDEQSAMHQHRRQTDAADGQPMRDYTPMRDDDWAPPEQPEHHQQGGQQGDSAQSGDKGKSDQDGGEGGAGKKPEKMSPQKKRRLIILAIVLGIILFIVGILYYLHARHFENTDDGFIDGHIAQVAPQVAGRILAIYIDDNQMVQAGQLLAEIDPRDFQVRLVQAQAQLKQAKAQTVLQVANIGQSAANVRQAEVEMERTKRDLARFRAINPKAISQQQFDNALAAEKTAEAKLLAAQESVDSAKAQEVADKAAVKQSEADIANATLQLSYTKIIAPFDGRVTKRSVELGNIVSAGQPLLAIVSPNLWVTANFKETQLTHMRRGQKVKIKVDTYPEVTFAGHVDSFQEGSGSAFSSLPAENATGNYVKVVQRVPVKILFDNPDQRDRYRLAPGMSVEPRVTVR